MANIDASRGIKRSAPDSPNSSQTEQPHGRARVDASTPDAIHRHLMSTFRHPQAIDWAQTQIVNAIAYGSLSPQFDQLDADEIFRSLLVNEEFTAFAALFNAYQDILEKTALNDGKPFKRVLELEMEDTNWSPQDPEGFRKAFEAVHVQRLVVGRMSGLQTEAQPDAISRAIATLLKTETLTELVINGPLASPRPVADALANSHLLSIEMVVGELDPQDFHPDVLDTCKTLAAAWAGCPKLKHLTLGHWELLALQPHIAGLVSCGAGAGLETVDLWSRNPIPAPDVISIGHANKEIVASETHEAFAPFMAEVAQIGSLKKIAAGITVDFSELKPLVFEPLKGHTHLTELDIQGVATNDRNACREDIDVFPGVLQFSLKCPALTRIDWDTGANAMSNRASDAIRNLIEIIKENPPGGNAMNATQILSSASQAQAIKEAMASPNFRLKWISLRGTVFTPGVLRAFAEALANNTTIEHVDLTGTGIDLEMTSVLMEALRTNTALTRALLPDDFSLFYVVGKDGRIYGFESVDDEVDGELVTNFRLILIEEDDEDEEDEEAAERARASNAAANAAANAAFDPLRTHASGLYTLFYDHLAKKRQDQIQSELAPRVQAALASGIKGSYPGAFEGAAHVIINQLKNDALPELVRLSEVNKAAAAARPRKGEPHSALVEAVKDARTRKAEEDTRKRDPFEQALSWMMPDQALSKAYAAHETAARDILFENVRAALPSHRFDHDEEVIKDIKSASVREAIRLANTEPTTTTTTTSTTAITTTTGAAFVATPPQTTEADDFASVWDEREPPPDIDTGDVFMDSPTNTAASDNSSALPHRSTDDEEPFES